jgi:PA14 domain
MKPVTSIVKRCFWLGVLALCATTANAQIQWLDADVGNPTFKGSSVNNSGVYTIQGGGSDIWGTASQFHYLYAWASGTNWEISAQFQSFEGPDQWSKVEFMVDLADTKVGPQGGDPFIAMMDTQPNTVTPPDGTNPGVNNGGVDQFRTAANGNADWLQVGATPAPAYPNDWFKIQRQTNIFNLYKSTNGADWVLYISIDTSKSNLIGQDNQTHFGTAWPDLVAVGIAVTAHNDGWQVGGVAAGATAVIANLSATFPPAIPPTLLAASQQVKSGATNVLGGEASLSFTATNNAWPISAAYPVAYQWFRNGSPVANATNSLHTWLLDISDNTAQYHCHASLAAPYNGITLDSATATIGVLPGVYYTNGLRIEMFSGVTSRTAVEVGNVSPAARVFVEPNFDDPGGYGNDYISRVSGWFLPPATDNYTFFTACDDDSDLFLSTDNTIANKRLIAQETGWKGMDQWLLGGGGSASWGQARSDQWSPDNGATIPYANGIPLNAGQPYYIENVHHQGGGGDNFSVTYQTATMMLDPNWATTFTNGTPSLLRGINNNIMYASIPATSLAWVRQPTNTTTTVGFPAKFYSLAASDSEFSLKYQWYRGLPPTGVAVTGATAANLSTANTVAGDNGATYYVVAATSENEFSITSFVATVNVALPVLEKGWALDEYWYTANPGVAAFYRSVTNNVGGIDYITNVLNTTYAVGADNTIYQPKFEGASKSNEAGDNFTERLSAYFYPPTTGQYVFFVNSDDDSALFVSTDSSPSNAVMVAQETGYSNPWQWTTAGGVVAQKRSDQWADPNGNVPWATGIHMIAGQQYYVAAIHHEGGGGDNVEATFKLLDDPDPALGSYTKMTGNLIGTYAPRCFSMAFAQQPGTVSVPLGGLVTLTVVGATDSKSAAGDNYDPRNEWNNFIVYQWTKNGVPIPGANSSAYSFGPATPLDSVPQFACQIRAVGYTDNSYVDIWSNSTPATIVLTGSAVYEPGFAFHRYWSLNPGRVSVENNVAGDPTWTMASPAFAVNDTGGDIADNFTDDLVGLFVPATSGNYVFFCNSDDDADLFLGTDNSASSRRIIARETAWAGALAWGTTGMNPAGAERSDTFVDPATQIMLYSNGIPLIAGQKYFMQIVHHQGGGGTESCVTYEKTDDPNYPNPPASGTPSAIRGSQLGSYVPKCTYVNVTTNPQPVTVDNYARATFTAGGATDSTVAIGGEGDWRPFFNNYLEFQWYKNGTPVLGATAAAFVIPQALPSDNGAQITCSMRALGYADGTGSPIWTNTSVAVLTVITGAPPQLLYAAIYTNNTANNPMTYVTLSFSSPMDPVALSNPANYVLGGGLSIQSITVNSNTYKNVVLIVTGTPSYPFTVTLNNARALGGGPVLVSTPTAVNRVPLTSADIGNAGDPSVPSGFYPSGTNAFTVECEGSDIWGNADGFNFSYEMKTGDFDVVVRQKKTTHTSNWSKGGLMVRETLDQSSRNWNIVNDPASADGIQAPDNSGFGANRVECNARIDTFGASGGWPTNNVPAVIPDYPNAWVRLTRTNNLLSAYCSTNNAASWTLMATNDPAVVGTLGEGNLPATVYVGICCTAHNNDPAGTPASQLRFMAYMDFDSYNSSYVYVPPTIITMGAPQRVGNNIVITWTPAVGHLLESPALGAGANWQPVTGGTGGSVSVPITGAGMFFRVVTP